MGIQLCIIFFNSNSLFFKVLHKSIYPTPLTSPHPPTPSSTMPLLLPVSISYAHMYANKNSTRVMEASDRLSNL